MLTADYPIAELNTRFVQSITEKFSAKDILEDVVANATYIGGYTGVKRKSIDDGPTLKRQRSASLFNNSVQKLMYDDQYIINNCEAVKYLRITTCSNDLHVLCLEIISVYPVLLSSIRGLVRV